jgi:hypothetical protein
VANLRDRSSGLLLKEGITNMFKYLHDRGWLRDPKISAPDLPPVVQACFGTCLKPALGDRLGRRSEREMVTMAEALGHILHGELAKS